MWRAVRSYHPLSLDVVHLADNIIAFSFFLRYKKGLPLSCYPLRNGMVLPPGAVLPSSVVVPPGMNIITQPLKPPTTDLVSSGGSGGQDGQNVPAGAVPCMTATQTTVLPVQPVAAEEGA